MNVPYRKDDISTIREKRSPLRVLLMLGLLVTTNISCSSDFFVAPLKKSVGWIEQVSFPEFEALLDAKLDVEMITPLLRTHRLVGVPYTDDQIENAYADLLAQAEPDGDWDGLEERYPGVALGNFDGQPDLTEMDALIAYMQVLGTMVDFSTFTPDASR